MSLCGGEEAVKADQKEEGSGAGEIARIKYWIFTGMRLRDGGVPAVEDLPAKQQFRRLGPDDGAFRLGGDACLLLSALLNSPWSQFQPAADPEEKEARPRPQKETRAGRRLAGVGFIAPAHEPRPADTPPCCRHGDIGGIRGATSGYHMRG